MRATARATFELKGFDEETAHEWEGGGKLTRATITRALGGDIEGEAVWHAVMCYDPEGRATIVGLEHVSGRLGDRQGTFVVTTRGEWDGTLMRSMTEVVPRSTTGGLAGLTGSGATEAPHGPTGTWELEYDLS